MELQNSSNRHADVNSLTWMQWQREVLTLLRADHSGALQTIQIEEVDGDAWRELYAVGRSPRFAIDHALARDF
jgi:hypothetical protein